MIHSHTNGECALTPDVKLLLIVLLVTSAVGCRRLGMKIESNDCSMALEQREIMSLAY